MTPIPTPAYNPLTDPPPPVVVLPHAPLLRVIVQVKYPTLATIQSLEAIAPFQEAIRGEYPELRTEDLAHLQVQLVGQSSVLTSSKKVWRFHDEQHHFRVSLSTEFLTLETTHYPGRAAFFDRFNRLVKVLIRCFNPSSYDRLGLRYIDRVEEEDVHALQALIRPELLGVLTTPLADRTHLSVCESHLTPREPDAQLRLQWALLAPGQTPDPLTIEPCNQQSWLLDLDMFSTKGGAFDASRIAERLTEFGARNYAIFRWAVTEAFLERFGGNR